MHAKILLFFIVVLFSVNSWGQISQGGIPLEMLSLKSASIPIVEMPIISNHLLIETAKIELYEANKLKPLKFAHTFKVNLSPENSGEWHKLSNGNYCWVLKIHSHNAKSINLIFDNFKLPENAKLFVFSEKENHTLGAFTSLNNKTSGKFAVAPVKGDEVTIQYEIPSKYLNEKHFAIKSVNHDFIGILDRNERRPLGIVAGACNIDINCDLGDDWNEVKNAVCRMIVDGTEICTGALINNTAEDQKPYVISAAHCYDEWEYAETTVYVFNYESPFCAPLDGDPINSVSGALMKAQFDSMDFALVELSLVPPPEFRPYYSGWERSVELPDSTVSIHHPQGDIKKIALDADQPVISDFNGDYAKNGFLKILRWEKGVTEAGSSGGPLFNMDQNLIGTLTGGIAVCGNPVRDYFERFSMSWDFKSDTTKQLKYWLDPLNTNDQTLNGNQFYAIEEACETFTNLNDNDTYKTVSLIESDEFSGYWGGTNSVGITEFVEQFSIYGNPQLSGISFGIGIIDLGNSNSTSEITIKVYNGDKLPETLIYSENILIKDLVEDAMNFIGFSEIVEPNDTFFVGFELSNMQSLDSFVVYQSLRPANTDNFLCFKQNNLWYNFEEENMGYNSMANVFELIACNIDDTVSDTPIVENPLEIYVFPNPADGVFNLKSGSKIIAENITVHNLIGQLVKIQTTNVNDFQIKINLTGNVPGVYFIRVHTTEGFVSRKVSFVPW